MDMECGVDLLHDGSGCQLRADSPAMHHLSNSMDIETDASEDCQACLDSSQWQVMLYSAPPQWAVECHGASSYPWDQESCW